MAYLTKSNNDYFIYCISCQSIYLLHSRFCLIRQSYLLVISLQDFWVNLRDRYNIPEIVANSRIWELGQKILIVKMLLCWVVYFSVIIKIFSPSLSYSLYLCSLPFLISMHSWELIDECIEYFFVILLHS